jgi:hypothetical protein
LIAMPRFVILEHDHPQLHWDFMLEEDGVLLTWRLPAPPPFSRGVMRAERIGDHRLAYLDYEGPVSGDRGAVKRWDRGNYSLEGKRPDGHYRLDGERWQGTVETRQRGKEWEIVFTPDLGERGQ